MSSEHFGNASVSVLLPLNSWLSSYEPQECCLFVEDSNALNWYAHVHYLRTTFETFDDSSKFDVANSLKTEKPWTF